MSGPRSPRPRGRGAGENPAGRFESLQVVFEEGDPDAPAPRTQFLRDTSRSLITTNDSPDVPFDASINIYRGCEHGCSYCYARPTHEYLGFSAGLDFETRILVKTAAPELLQRELASPRWQPRVLGISGVTDSYQPVERRLELTRRCLEVLARSRQPVGIITKNALVLRDRDHLEKLAAHEAAVVYISVTTLRNDLAARLEPRASSPESRLRAIRELGEAGIPVGVLVAPVIPGLTDTELPEILARAAEAGARHAGYVVLRLPHGLTELFTAWLDEHLPDRREKILSRLRSMRGGRLNSAEFGSRMAGEGEFARQIASLYRIACKRHGLLEEGPRLSTASFRPPGGPDDFLDELFEA